MSRYIDTDELWKEIESVEYYGRDAEVSRICSLIQNAPTADVKPIVYGEWIIDKHNRVAQCSVCNKISPYDYGDFCKWCGADMRKESEEEL